MATPERPEIQRPLSPHLQVYKPQLTSVLSILHRITGLIGAVAAFGLTWMLLAIAAGPDAYTAFVECAASLPGQIVLFVVTAVLAYHLCNGVRHLFWDAGKGLDLTSTYRSGYAVIVVALALTVAVWVLALGGAA